jgi:hypothetical protein
MKTFALFAAIFALALGAEATKLASAATITETIDFTASGFTPSGAPVDPVIGSFTITLDPTMMILGGTVTLDVNLTLSTIPPFFDYFPPIGGFASDLFVCSSAEDQHCGTTPGTFRTNTRLPKYADVL